ncbi:hypothetical protein GV794_28980, partial [Nocardia cyriacigeorgica]|nr:hypothetical protein [Nocardia cyriacigeorgica]
TQVLAGSMTVTPARTLNRYILERHMRAGVRIGRDVTLRPGVQLLGNTVIGEDAEVGPDSTLTDVIVGEGAKVVRTHGEGAVIGPAAPVGPFSF